MAAQDNSQVDRVQFGPFLLTPTKRLLEQDGIAVPLGGRALDILIALAERAGEIVGKRDLLERVWPDVTVDEGSIRFHVAALRKALGDGQDGARYVTTVPGRGYCLVAPVSRLLESTAPAGAEPLLDRSRLPARLARMVGRDETVRTISARLVADRFVTIVGPGGIGKTTVAVSVAHGLTAEFEGAIRFIDLGTLSDPRLISGSLATALGLPVGSDNGIPTLVSHLRDKRMLLVFDSCEHVIEGAAELSETIFIEAPLVHILATSREPLRVEGEHVDRLFPLDYPPDDAGLTAQEALGFPAVQLFVERVDAGTQSLTFGDEDARAAAEICRKLDGIALAIELAAGRVAAYGIQGTAALLDDQFALVWRGRRTAPPRHQTLNATLDWSYNLLPEFERDVLSALSVLVGPFTLDAAGAVAVANPLRSAELAEAIAHLVEKSLLSTVLGGGETRYRLLDMARAYAMRKLIENRLVNVVRRRHAEYFQAWLVAVGADLNEMIRLDRIVEYADKMGNIRSALVWSFSSEGDLEIGVRLAAAATPAFMSMSLWQECEQWTEKALASLQGARGTRYEMILQRSLARSLIVRHDQIDLAQTAYVRALEIAEELDDTWQQRRLISHLRTISALTPHSQNILRWALKGKAVADAMNDPLEIALSEAELGMSYFIIGDHANAQINCEAGITHINMLCENNTGHFNSDVLIQTRAALSSTQWYRGFPDQAAASGRVIIADAEAGTDFLLIVHSITWLISIFLWRGDWPISEYMIERLISIAKAHSLHTYNRIAIGLKGQLFVGRGEIEAGVSLLQESKESLSLTGSQICNLMSLASALASLGNFEEALLAIDQAIPKGDRLWGSQHTSEILRVKGNILASAPGADFGQAELWLSEAAEIARRQGALSWELRIATSRASLWRKHGRSDEARDMLASVYGRFTEGFDTIDLIAAKRLLDELA